jgi:hypothetical protein
VRFVSLVRLLGGGGLRAAAGDGLDSGCTTDIEEEILALVLQLRKEWEGE